MTTRAIEQGIDTFKEHCVVNDGWLGSAYAAKLPFVWHSKIQDVLHLVEANSRDLDRYIGLIKTVARGHLTEDAAHHKRKFFDAQTAVESVIERVRHGYPRLLEALAPASDVHRARALHTFAGAAALTLIKVLQQFEGVLITEQGSLIVRLYPDLPSLRTRTSPMVVLPFRHAVNGLAYGHEVDNGFVRARICWNNESNHEKLSLPRRDAEHWQDRHPGPEHLYFGWVLPQWAVAGLGDFPPAETWWISVLSNERGNERNFKYEDPDWKNALGPVPLFDEEYAGLDAGGIALEEVAPRLTVWVLPRAAGIPATEALRGATGPKSELSETNVAEQSAAENISIVLCIAAAQVEFVAARKRFEQDFGKGKEMSIERGADHAVVFTDSVSRTRWVLTVQSFQAELDAALKAQRLVLTLKPMVTLMIGMCMGMPERKAAIGTVVVPNEVRGFDHQRVTPKGLEYRPHGDLTDNPLYCFARTFDYSTLKYAVVVDKGLASASVKMEDIGGPLVKCIQANFPDAAAYDMEGWGFYRGIKAARVDGNPRCLWIKGIADNGETQDPSPEAQAAKKAEQARATDNALDFAIQLIRGYVKVETFDPS